MAKQLFRFFLLMLIVFVGLGSWERDVAFADGGFDVPTVNDEFDQFDQKPPVQKEQPVESHSVKEEKGFLDYITEPISAAWDWTTEKVSGAWEWTKEKAAAFWDWFVEICSKIAEVVVDALSATWDWIVKYKEYIAFAVILVVGIILCIFPVTAGLGASILWGMGISFLISAVFNGGIDKNTFLEAAIGGVLGIVGLGIAGGVSRGLATNFGKGMITGAKNTRFLGSILNGGQKLVSKLPAPIQNMFTKAGFVGTVEGAGTAIADDILHGRKISWKNVVISALAGAFLVGTFHAAPSMVNYGEKVGIVGKACASQFNCTIITNGRSQTITRQQLDNYLADIEQQTGVQIGEEQRRLVLEHMNNNTYTKLSPQETARKRARFNSIKDDLIEEWERQTGQNWPRYTEPYYTRSGRLYKEVGDLYDAHHIIENNYNGPDVWWNIHPARFPDQHQGGIHRSGSPGRGIFPRR